MGLFEVVGVLGLVHVRGDLVDPRERVHQGEVVARGVEARGVDPVLARDLAVLVLVGEALALDPGDVEHVELREHGVEVGVFLDVRARFVEVVAHRTRKAKALGADEVLAGVELRERVGQRVHSSTILQVAHDPHREVREAVGVLAHGVEVEEGLGGVLARAVARVDERDVDELRGHRRRALARVAEHQRVGVALGHAHRIGEALALGRAGGFDRSHPERVAAEALDRRFEAHSRARARLEEEQTEQGPGVARAVRWRALDLGRAVTHRLDVRAREVLRADDLVGVAVREAHDQPPLRRSGSAIVTSSRLA